MSIPFTQFLRPNGRKRAVEIEMSPEIEAMAQRFIESGGWFECEELTTGHANLTACKVVDDEPQDIEGITCPNDSDVVTSVEWLVKKSQEHLS